MLWHKLSTKKQNYIVIGSFTLLAIVAIVVSSVITRID